MSLQNINIDAIEACVEKLHDTFDRTDLDIETKKIQQKIDEIRFNSGDVKPLADCILSLLLAARNHGFKAGIVLKSLEDISKENINKKWRKMTDGTYQSM